jgi:coenzyme F420-reducing hydrogenase delta subunit
MCTGRVDPAFIFRAFSNGTDGVFLVGCWPRECHYPTEGNYYALSIVLLTRKILEHIGVNPERIRIEWVSAAEGVRYASLTSEFARQIKEIGPFGKSEGIDGERLNFRLKAVQNLLPYIKMVERERLRVPVITEEAIREFYSSVEADRLFRDLILDPLVKSEIMALLREIPLSIREISEKLGLSASETSRYLQLSARQGLVRFDEGQKRFAPA